MSSGFNGGFMSSGFNGGFMSSGFNGGFMSSGYYYQSAASFCTLPINTGYSHTLVSTFFTSGLWFYILCLTVYCLFSSSGEFNVIIPSTGVMFSNSTHVNTVPLYLNSVPSNAPPSYVYAQPSVVNQVGPPELSPAARLLARTYENQALVFRDEQGQERVYCSICSHRGTKYHAKAVIAKEKGKQPLEPAVTAPEPVFGATSEQGSVTAVTVEVSLLQQLVTCMEKVVTSVLFQQYQRCQQNNRSVHDYTCEFNRLTTRTKLSESTSQRVARYMEGLKPQIRNRIGIQHIRTLRDAKSFALKAEQMIQQTLSATNKIVTEPDLRGRHQEKQPTQQISEKKGAVEGFKNTPAQQQLGGRPNTNPYSRPFMGKCYRCGGPETEFCDPDGDGDMNDGDSDNDLLAGVCRRVSGQHPSMENIIGGKVARTLESQMEPHPNSYTLGRIAATSGGIRVAQRYSFEQTTYTATTIGTGSSGILMLAVQHSSTGHSPFSLVYTKVPTIVVDLLPPGREPRGTADEVDERIVETREETIQKLHEANKRYKEKADVHRREKIFEVGDEYGDPTPLQNSRSSSSPMEEHDAEQTGAPDS
ncbi:hypothetical protein SASPL_155938 [Salvia splendens]|uniref:Rieske domain-containing protein n=1 Tax=Salvia splendens TaxID=180675 RepID=A0A8X8YWM1_SALSN|nr:hypothetical protein SASPL_155938 [Salvia splendens]